MFELREIRGIWGLDKNLHRRGAEAGKDRGENAEKIGAPDIQDGVSDKADRVGIYVPHER